MAQVEVEVTLRERNQMTLPEPIVERLGARVGDRFLISVTQDDSGFARIRPLRQSYAGAARGMFGATHEQQVAAVEGERASWDPTDPGTASDGTSYLTFEGSRRTYRNVTRERYERDRRLRRPKCDICGRSIARMNEHKAAHREGHIDEEGLNTDTAHKARSKARVTK